MDSAMNRLFGARDMIKTLEAERSAVLDTMASPELRAELTRIEGLMAAANAVLAQALIEAGEELHHLKVREYSHDLEAQTPPATD
jgi:hypothetical protein